MDTIHNIFPQRHMPGLTDTVHRFVFIISTPYRAGIIWSISRDPQVCTVLGRTCLAGSRHAVQPCRSTGTLFDNILHSTGKEGCSRILEYLMCIGCCIVQQDISVMVKYLRIQNGLCIYTVICDRSISGGHLCIIDTPCDTS